MARNINTIFSNYKLVTFSPLFSNGPCEVEWAFTPLKSISQNGKDLHEMENLFHTKDLSYVLIGEGFPLSSLL